MRKLITFAVCAAALSAQVTVTEEMFHGRHAWVLSNGAIRVSVLSGGGHIGEIRLISGDSKKSINPMRIPHYQPIDPQTFDPAKHAAIYGNEPHKWLSAGYMGHMLCFPLYGPPSGDEVKAGLGSHGEAPVVEWRRTKAASDVSFSYAADLPKTQYRVERAIHLAPGARSVRVEEWIENLTHYDRPYNLMEHATFGPPFVEIGSISATKASGRTGIGERSDRPNAILLSMSTGICLAGADVAASRAGAIGAVGRGPKVRSITAKVPMISARVVTGTIISCSSGLTGAAKLKGRFETAKSPMNAVFAKTGESLITGFGGANGESVRIATSSPNMSGFLKIAGATNDAGLVIRNGATVR